MTKKIGLVGYGAMGQRIAAAIEQHEGWELAGAVDPKNAECYAKLDEIPCEIDVVIDFSHPANLDMVCEFVRKTGIAAVLSTTGFSPAQEAQIKELSAHAPIVRTQNTSLGVNIMQQVLKMITPILMDKFDIEIVEKHHNKKIDAPSGTAKMLAQTIEECGEFREIHGRDGICQRKNMDIGVHAIRGGTICGEHEVIFAGDDEIIEIKHTALSKQVFVCGAIKAAEFALKAEKGFYSMGDALFGE